MIQYDQIDNNMRITYNNHLEESIYVMKHILKKDRNFSAKLLVQFLSEVNRLCIFVNVTITCEQLLYLCRFTKVDLH